jgi:hypothetical protein
MQIALIQNQYRQNFAGNQSSIVNIEGYPIFKSVLEEYSDNENWYPEAFKLSVLSKYFNLTSSPKVYSGMADFNLKSKSIVSVWRPLIVEVTGSKFKNNFVVDDFDPTVLYTNVQSHALLFRDFAGKITLNGGVTF